MTKAKAGKATATVEGEKRIAASDARSQLATLLNQVAFGKIRVVLHRRGEEIAALIPIEAYRLLESYLEELEDRLDIEEAERILADPTQVPIPLEEVIKKHRWE